MPHESRSSPREIQNYLGRISGPLLDRIDLHIEVPLVKFRASSRARRDGPSTTTETICGKTQNQLQCTHGQP
jgi:magnesium chelatase family protein